MLQKITTTTTTTNCWVFATINNKPNKKHHDLATVKRLLEIIIKKQQQIVDWVLFATNFKVREVLGLILPCYLCFASNWISPRINSYTFDLISRCCWDNPFCFISGCCWDNPFARFLGAAETTHAFLFHEEKVKVSSGKEQGRWLALHSKKNQIFPLRVMKKLHL